jgi:16S rRNA (cytosine967-C5)-methyltransferase
LTYFNNQPPNYIRINNLKRSINVFDELKENNYVIQKDEFCSSIYQIVRSGINKLPNLTSFKEGLFFIQARSSAYIPLMVNPQPQELILDTCASPGGKTTFLADLMQNTGKIIAIDINPDRIKELNNNLDKYGVKNTETKMIDIRNFETDERFDKILIDAPCSGTGTLASRPYARWRLSKQRVKAYFKLQLEIINAAIKFLKPEEGLLFYVTCSLLPEENEDVIKAFLENQKTNIQPVPLSFDIGSRISFYGRRLLPQVMQSEGFSIFCFKKNE